MVGLLSLESCCGRPKMRNSVVDWIKRQEIGRHPVGYLVIQGSYSNLEFQETWKKPVIFN